MGSPLYVNAKGIEVNTGSYSAGSEFGYCRRKFQLHRIKGYYEKQRKASLEIGKVFESAIQFYHENGLKPGDCVNEAKRLWLKFAEVELVYTDQEGDWKTVYGMLAAWARLYEIKRPQWPIHNPKFQLNYRKALWPGDPTYGNLEDQAYIDLLSTLPDGRRIIVDIKTSKGALDETPNLMSMDDQLRRYAWLSGIRDVAFLWAVKAKPSYRKNDIVSLLEDAGGFETGDSLVVYKSYEDEGRVLLGTAESVRKMDEILDGISGKGSAERKGAALADAVSYGLLFSVSLDAITKCRLQFVPATISESELPNVGKKVGHEIIAIQNAAKTDFFPQDGGVRYPNNKCTSCCMRGICLDIPALKDELLVRIVAAPKEMDWLEELEQEAEGD